MLSNAEIPVENIIENINFDTPEHGTEADEYPDAGQSSSGTSSVLPQTGHNQ